MLVFLFDGSQIYFRLSRSGRWIDVNPELEHLLANAPKITPEEQREWKELEKKIQDTAAPPDSIFVTVSTRDQIFGEVDKAYAVKFKDVLEECRLVFNHHRKSLKIGAGWRQFCQTLSLDAGTEIVFEFINPRVNRVLYWLCSVDEMR
ncbi:hypothetical protein JHK84_048156 [Glycine max]|nr:hypothetical protein JHK86_048123 [Glycine max]KAG4944103.1 hypothetical protein JHK85_048749 [Glycine max]KAG5103187.1 hypothetical protein JHK84_048156 [Glycine max]